MNHTCSGYAVEYCMCHRLLGLLVVAVVAVLALVLAVVLALVSGLVLVLVLASSSLPTAVPRPFTAVVASRDRERGFPALERFRRPAGLASSTASLDAAVANFSERDPIGQYVDKRRGRRLRGDVRATGEGGGVAKPMTKDWKKIKVEKHAE